MAIDFLLKKFEENRHLPAIIWDNRAVSYAELLQKINEARQFLSDKKVGSGEVVGLLADFTPNTIALLLALIENQNLIAPFNQPIKEAEAQKFAIAALQKRIVVNLETDEFEIENLDFKGNHPFYETLRKRNASGLVLFTSGTSGFPKGAVHDFGKLLVKFQTQRKALRTINFLLFDHWGGLNTLFYTLSNCGTVLALRNRRPDSVCEFVETHKIELLPVSPSFLNLLILSEVYKKYDLSSLKIISYGTEPMPESTLKRAKEIFPEVQFQQTYGLIELGVLRSKSKSDDSLWVKLGGDGFDLRVVDGILQIKADSAMLGYLNAPSPFTEDGYFITGDMVETDGDYFKILGRKSELINVGGDKVYPQEVENVLLSMENVLEVTVFGEKHAMLGNIVCAKIRLKTAEDSKEFSKKVKAFCKGKLQPFKIPIKISVEHEALFSERMKKIRQ